LTQIFRTLTVYQNLSAGVFAAYRKTFNLFAPASGLLRDKVLDLANEVGLSGQIKKEAGSLSYGTTKRLEVAIALSNGPQLLFLDEPTGGLAPDECAQDSWNSSGDLSQERNMTTVFIEHDMATVFGFCPENLCPEFWNDHRGLESLRRSGRTRRCRDCIWGRAVVEVVCWR